jgi:hypothetical protein
LRYKWLELNEPQTDCLFERKTSTEHSWYDGVIIVSPKNCPCCFSTKLSKMVVSITKGFGGYSVSVEAGADGAREDFVAAFGGNMASANRPFFCVGSSRST